MRASIEVVRAPLRRPFGAAWGQVRERELILLELEDGEGVRGYGEAAPLAGYDGVTVGDVLGGLDACRELIESADAAEPGLLLAACAERTLVGPALAAIDLALWDLAGRRAGLPAWALIGAPAGTPTTVNATVDAPDRASAAAAAGAARTAGYGTLKLKVGTGDDAGRLAAVRAASGPEMRIRLDANGAWTVQEARAALERLAPAGLELCEEPVSGADAIAMLAAQIDVPLAIDETAAEPGALDRPLCHAACLKVGRCGGISGLLGAARRARSAGYALYLASTLDGPLGIAAALHAASVLGPDYACGLATLELFERDCDPLTVRGGVLVPPVGPGLGDGLREWYAGRV